LDFTSYNDIGFIKIRESKAMLVLGVLVRNDLSIKYENVESCHKIHIIVIILTIIICIQLLSDQSNIIYPCTDKILIPMTGLEMVDRQPSSHSKVWQRRCINSIGTLRIVLSWPKTSNLKHRYGEGVEVSWRYKHRQLSILTIDFWMLWMRHHLSSKTKMWFLKKKKKNKTNKWKFWRDVFPEVK